VLPGAGLDPFNPALYSCLGFHHLLAGDEEQAFDATRQALAFEPKHGWALMTLGWIYEQRGKFEEAIAALRKSWGITIQRASIAHAFARSGNRPPAERSFCLQPRYRSVVWMDTWPSRNWI